MTIKWTAVLFLTLFSSTIVFRSWAYFTLPIISLAYLTLPIIWVMFAYWVKRNFDQQSFSQWNWKNDMGWILFIILFELSTFVPLFPIQLFTDLLLLGFFCLWAQLRHHIGGEKLVWVIVMGMISGLFIRPYYLTLLIIVYGIVLTIYDYGKNQLKPNDVNDIL